ncbi:octanoyltransferase [bacterium BMS3Abin03]|nr:octanoyltransferase [bacterium BMS3Abin03]
MTKKKLTYYNLGTIDYKEAWNLQKRIFEQRYKNEVDDTLLLLEHSHTYTLGKTADKKNLVGTDEYLKKNNVSVYNIDRGGDITYHGPGQVVGYPVINLNNWERDTHKYLRALEEVIIKTCEDYNLKTGRVPKFTGVWIDDRKIAAIGIKVSRWITMHGFAFNVNTDLEFFNGIIPCGIKDKAVTSLQKELGKEINLNEVKEKLVFHFKELFNYDEIVRLKEEDLTLTEIL